MLAASAKARTALAALLLAGALLWPGPYRICSWGLGAAARLAPPLSPAPYLGESQSPELLDRNGQLLHAFLDPSEQWAFPRPLASMSPPLVEATLAAEDKRFYDHPGVDAWAALRALGQNLTGRRVVSGASTITMQVIKRLDQPARTMPGKLRQMWAALRLERTADKAAILQAYLNTAPYGGNLVGAEAAARRYFNKPAAELTLAEAALLAGLPKSPTSMNPLKHPQRTLARRNAVLRRMRRNGQADERAFQEALKAPLGAAWHEFPRQAPHLPMALKKEMAQKKRLFTTLDAAVQEQCEWMALKHLSRFNGEITNAALIVADVPRGTVLARVGSADFFGARLGGQLDLCQRPRSPGSALKPFTYALALEKNRLYPTEQLLDRELDFGSYNPANFQADFNGLISVTEALRMSLNIPAVMVLDRVGVDDLCGFLRRAGFNTLVRAPGDYGLGLTLGNCEVTLESIAGAYAMLANLGQYRPLRRLQDEPARQPTQLLSRGAALALYDMLDQPFPTELDRNLVSTQGVAPRVCWKTGTSTGFHDAWAIAYNAQYLVAVWLGNNTGKPSRRLVGVQAALPLAAAIFRGLPPQNSPAWPDPGDDLHPVKICALTGLPADQVCPATDTVSLPKSLYLNRRCAVHQPDPSGKVAEHWPAMPRAWDLAAVPRAAGRENATSAPQSPDAAAQTVLAILSPPDKSEYVLTGEKNGDRIPLSASRDNQCTLHWYLDGRYLGDGKPQQPLFLDLTLGTHQVTCMDANGDTASAAFTVHAE